MAAAPNWKFVVWERLNKTGKWCPYSAEISQLLEQSRKKDLSTASLGDADENMKIYSVDLKEMTQVSQITGTKSSVRRCVCDTVNDFCKGYTWQWSDSQDSWHSYDIDVSNFIEQALLQGKKHITLNKNFRGYHYEIDFVKMSQINKQSKRKRPIRRQQQTSPYPVINLSSESEESSQISPNASEGNVPETNPREENVSQMYPELLRPIPGADLLNAQLDSYMRNARSEFVQNEVPSPALMDVSTSDNPQSDIQNSQTVTLTATVNGHPWYDSKPPWTPESKLKPVPGINPLPITPKQKKPKKKKKKAKHEESNNQVVETILEQHTCKFDIQPCNNNEQDDCIICCESLSEGSSYDDDPTLLKLKLCSHIFHKSCLLAMYNSGPKDQSLQCPTCKRIHGEKCGIQPPGSMVFHVLPYSLPGFTECDTIRIIYNIPSGIQGPEHPHPGKKYTSRGFPRHCFLPDNEIGRKVLRLLIKAWKRRLIFTIGQSSTTGEENTVTWNEIHHKTEFGCSRRGHGYPDPNYFDNVMSELEAHGVKDDDVYLWYPA